MTDSLFRITPTPPTSAEVEPGKEHKFSFTVESLAAPDKVHEVILQALLVGEEGKGKEADWLVPGPKQTLSMSGGETQIVSITARPKPASPRGEHKIKLVIADKDRPNDVFAEAPTVACKVLGPAEAPAAKKRLPWWLIPAILGGVLLVGGGILLVWKLTSGGPDRPDRPDLPGLGEPCPANVCAEGLLCDQSKTCREQVATPACAADARECTPDGSTRVCEDGSWKTEPCPANTACDPTTRACKGTCTAGPADVPWPGWETAHPAQPGDSTTTVGPAADSKLTGSPASNNSANVDGVDLLVGDTQFLGGTTTNDLVEQGAVTFDLSGIPPTAKIVSATLQLFQTGTSGAAFQPPLTQVVIDHVRFPSAWGADESPAITATLGGSGAVLSVSPAVGLRTVDVTPAVRYDLASCQPRSQFRLKFSPGMSIPNAVEDEARFASDNAAANRPALVVRWRN